MRNCIIILVLILIGVSAYSQKYDMQWVIGPNTSVVNFNIDTVGLTPIEPYMNTWETNASICDSNGNLLYYTNGFYIADKNGNTLTANSDVVPNMINYNLGALVGSGCDTIHTGITSVNVDNLLRIMPNPADKYLYVEMGMQGNYEFDLINEVGQVIDRKETRQVDNFDTEQLANGVYFLRVIEKNDYNNIITRKFMVAH